MTDPLSYHRHLASITEGDLDYVRRKDAQYQASWKRHGGVGAFFTIVRPWDRLYSMVTAPDKVWPQYDLMRAVLHEMDGKDGSVLACVRDLRRYLLLVEAEALEQQLNEVDGDSSRHASLVPWVASTRYFERQRLEEPTILRWWKKITTGRFVLEPWVEGHQSPPAVMTGLYFFVPDMGWRIKMEHCPPDARDYFPMLRSKLNAKEHAELPEWQRDMYEWLVGGGFRILPHNQAWVE